VRPSLGAQAPDRIVTLAGAVLMTGAFQFGPHERLWSAPDVVVWPLAGLTVAGLLFTWWARVHLGALWSGSVTRKDDHRIVESGPYGLVRHPIYTGIIFALFATALARGLAGPLIGAALMTLGFWMKARLEENFLSAELGDAAYADYRRRVPMLIPFLKLGAAS
jgi:protein-S-isoprenylcysteine O-methyltransferase Ste14